MWRECNTRHIVLHIPANISFNIASTRKYFLHCAYCYSKESYNVNVRKDNIISQLQQTTKWFLLNDPDDTESKVSKRARVTRAARIKHLHLLSQRRVYPSLDSRTLAYILISRNISLLCLSEVDCSPNAAKIKEILDMSYATFEFCSKWWFKCKVSNASACSRYAQIYSRILSALIWFMVRQCILLIIII